MLIFGLGFVLRRWAFSDSLEIKRLPCITLSVMLVLHKVPLWHSVDSEAHMKLCAMVHSKNRISPLLSHLSSLPLLVFNRHDIVGWPRLCGLDRVWPVPRLFLPCWRHWLVPSATIFGLEICHVVLSLSFTVRSVTPGVVNSKPAKNKNKGYHALLSFTYSFSEENASFLS